MWDTVRTFLGSASASEFALAALFFLCIVSFTWAPRIGESIGGLLETQDDEGED